MSHVTATQMTHSYTFSFNPNKEIQEKISVFETCIKYVRSWMLQNKLKLNDSKTEFMIIGTPPTNIKTGCH